MRIERYQGEHALIWDAYIAQAKNATFLLRRPYMDYHASRFQDYSLLIYDEGGRPLALFPATRDQTTVTSHGGLTYGGFITDARMTTPVMIELFDMLISYLQSDGIALLIYKTMPAIYHQHFAEEDRYALFALNATLFRRDVLSVIDRRDKIPFQKRRQRQIAKAERAGLEVGASDRFEDYWQILEDVLDRTHGVKPVHTSAEIRLLKQRFPDEISLYVCLDQQEIVAGVVLFRTTKVTHVQYICSTAQGREYGALDALFAFLIEDPTDHRPYFDFGISTEQNGSVLNVGLIEQKEGFGARASVHDFYQLAIG